MPWWAYTLMAIAFFIFVLAICYAEEIVDLFGRPIGGK